jgi:hypothetical protein
LSLRSPTHRPGPTRQLQGRARAAADLATVSQRQAHAQPFGGFGFGAIPFDEFVIEGKAEPAWLQARRETKNNPSTACRLRSNGIA